MDKLITAITDWPALAQGVVGAAIFTVLVLLGTKTYNLCSYYVGKVSKGNRLYRAKNEYIRCVAVKAGESQDLATSGIYAAILWYRASRQLIKAFIWMTLGLISGSIPVFSAVGFLGCLFYLLNAFQVVRPFAGSHADLDTKITDLKRQIAELESAANARAGKS
jgi:hypothetical protein